MDRGPNHWIWRLGWEKAACYLLCCFWSPWIAHKDSLWQQERYLVDLYISLGNLQTLPIIWPYCHTKYMIWGIRHGGTRCEGRLEDQCHREKVVAYWYQTWRWCVACRGRIEKVNEFTYLRSFGSKKGYTDEDIQARIQLERKDRHFQCWDQYGDPQH